MCNKNLTIPFPISLEHIPYLWERSDVLILLVDLDNYDTFNTDCLGRIEIEHLEGLQTSYFKKRYTVSRMVLKHILCSILNERSASDISTYKDGNGRVCIHNHNEMYICISYTENIAALAISKVEVGIDIELGRTLALKNTLKFLREKSSFTDKPLSKTDILKTWTLKEAYCKFSNKNMLPNLNKYLNLSSVSHSSYFLDNKYIFSVITHSGSHILNINHLQKIDCNWN